MELEGQSGDAGHQRFDFAEIGKVELLSTGALRIPAVLGRVGVFSYIRDGKTVRELRPPDEVFRADSMATLASACVTDKHPPRDKAWVTPENWKEHAVGHVVDGVRQDGDLLRGYVVVQDAEMIRMIQAGERKELSPGYKPLNLDATPGRWDAHTGEYGPDVKTGVEYDVVQRDIFYNSMGIGPRGWGRQGSAVALRLDSVHGGAHAMASHRDNQLGDFLTSKMKQLGKTVAELAAETGIIEPKETEPKPLLRSGPRPRRTFVLESILDGWTNRPSDAQLKALGKALDVPLDDLMNLIPDDLQRLDGGENLNPQQASKTMDTIDTDDLHLDGLTAASVPKPAAEIIKKVIADRDAQIKTLTEAASANKGRLDGVTEQLATATKSLTELPGQMKTEIAARAKLEGQALTVLGADMKLDGKTDRQVQELVIQGVAKAAGRGELTLDAKDDSYVAARFDVAMEGFKAPDATARATHAITGGPKPAVTLDAADAPDPEAARASMIQGQADASKTKLKAV